MKNVYVVMNKRGGGPLGVFSTEQKAVDYLNSRGAIQTEEEIEIDDLYGNRKKEIEISFVDGHQTFEIFEEELDSGNYFGRHRTTFTPTFVNSLQREMNEIIRNDPFIDRQVAYNMARKNLNR